MKISQDIRDAARSQNDSAQGLASDAQLSAELDEMARKFRESGGEIRIPLPTPG
jgi:hypothetical protein